MSIADFPLEYYGQALPGETLEAFVARQVDYKNWSVSAERYDRKWWGYRTLTPAQCLFIFADEFVKATRNLKGRGTGSFAMRERTKANYLTQSKKRNVTGFWTAMCVADDHGIPYDFYCARALEWAERCGWRKLPSPTQLYGTDMTFAIKRAWEERLETGTMVTTQNPMFSVQAYCGHKWQDEYMKWLIDQALTRPNPKYALVKIIFAEPQVTLDYARQRLGPERLEDIKNAA